MGLAGLWTVIAHGQATRRDGKGDDCYDPNAGYTGAVDLRSMHLGRSQQQERERKKRQARDEEDDARRRRGQDSTFYNPPPPPPPAPSFDWSSIAGSPSPAPDFSSGGGGSFGGGGASGDW